ncbi:MAG TPA: cytochrome P450 [Acidimicrobiales bacterium]|nr:cytochrome P450 [Acidimicrobiales bacterium]
MPDTGVATSGRAPATPPTWPFPIDDPYPAYARARAGFPAGVGWSDELGAWLVLSHAGVNEVLRSEAWSADPQRSPELMARMAPGLAESSFLSRMLLFSDPPEHDRLRAAVNRFFTPRRVEAIRGRVASIVNAAFSGAGTPVDSGVDVNVIEEIAYPVPLAVICELFDVGTDTALLLREETPVMAAMLDLLAPPSLQSEAAGAAMSAMMALVPIVAERRKSPGEDLLSVLAERLEPDEAVIMALLLLAAGHETTSALIGNAVMAAAATGSIPADVDGFVEEVLRWDSPVQVTGRIAAADHALFGCPVRAGDQAVLVLGAANRDPEVFDDPDRFDPSRFAPGRPRTAHLAFGHGAHFCVGAALARIEAAEVVRRLASLDWELGEHERAASSTFRRMRNLKIRA